MSEREDLAVIGKLLNLPGGEVESELELLRSIVTHLKSPSSKINANKIPESLAFPRKETQHQNLLEANDLWDELHKFNEILRQDHKCRRKMLLNRLDCTVESFMWKGADSNKKETAKIASKKSTNDLIHETYEISRLKIKDEPQVDMSHLLAIRETECDTLLNSVVSSRTVDCKISQPTQSRMDSKNDPVQLKKVIIPEVPDRGGRPGEIRPPVKETFSRQRRDFGGSRGRGGGCGGRGRRH